MAVVTDFCDTHVSDWPAVDMVTDFCDTCVSDWLAVAVVTDFCDTRVSDWLAVAVAVVTDFCDTRVSWIMMTHDHPFTVVLAKYLCVFCLSNVTLSDPRMAIGSLIL